MVTILYCSCTTGQGICCPHPRLTRPLHAPGWPQVHVFLSSLPRRGVLSLRQRDLGRLPTDRDNMDAMLPENKEYETLALYAAEHQVSHLGCVPWVFSLRSLMVVF